MTPASSAVESKAAVLRDVGGPFRIESIRVAAPGPGEVRVQIKGVGMCHTDLSARDGFPVPMPVVLGHEGAGIVESVGPGVSKVKVGDHVVLSFASCAQCPSCARHEPAYCFNFLAHNFSGGRPADGSSALSQNGAALHGNYFGQSSFAQYAIAHERNTIIVDKRLPLEILGPLGCGIQTGAGAAVNSVKIGKGQSLAIFGGGAVGLSALLGARAVEAGTVIVVEPNAQRAALALELGATHVVDPKTTPDTVAAIKSLSGGGVTHALETTGIPAVMANAFETMLPNGMLGLLAVPPPDGTLTLSLMALLVRGVGVKSIIEGDSDPQTFIPRMLDWFRSGRFPFDKLIKTFAFDQINEAAHASERGEAIKPVLVI